MLVLLRQVEWLVGFEILLGIISIRWINVPVHKCVFDIELS